MKISIIIPEKNQAEKVLRNIKGMIIPYFDSTNLVYEILISPNGCSKDDVALLNEARKYLPGQIKILENGPGGKGNGVKAGIKAAEGDYTLFMDADCATDLHVFDNIKNRLKDADCFCASRDVKGSSYGKKQPLKRRFSHFACRKIIAFLFRLGIKDTQCGYKIFKTSVAKEMFKHQKIPGFAFDVEYLVFLKDNGFLIKEVPCLWTDDPDSTIGPRNHSVYRTFMKDLIIIKKTRKTYLLPEDIRKELRGGKYAD